MKILIFAPYIYDRTHSEFSKTRSGFGYMVKDILTEVAKYDEVLLITHQFTKGYKNGYTVLKHTKMDMLINLNLKNICKGIKCFFVSKAPMANKIRYAYYYFNAGSVKKCVDTVKPDLIHIHGLTLQTKPIIEMCNAFGYPYIVTLHGLIGLDESTNAPQADKMYEYEALREFDKCNQTITVISSGILNRIINHYKLSGRNIRVILNGTYLPQNIIKVNMPKKIFLCIGTVSKRKNQMQLLRVCLLLRNEFRCSMEIHIVGALGDQINIAEQISELGLEDVIKYDGFIQREEMDKLWQRADYNIVMSKDEGFGLSIIEGYAYGVPTITFSDLDAVRDLYNGNSMILIDNRTDAAVAEALTLAVEKQWDSKKIIEISKRYSMEMMGKAYRDLYHYEIKEKSKRNGQMYKD